MTRATLRMTWVTVLFSLTVVWAAAQSAVGTITRIYGDVLIDAFGVGDFISVVVPEAVYRDTVVRTDYESWAYLTIEGTQYTVGPSSSTPVSSFLSSRRQDRGEGFFSRILRELTRSLTPPEEDDIVAGGRASRVEGTGTDWVFDIDPDQLFEQALERLEEGEFESAVESLRLIDYPEDGHFPLEEYYVNLAYALMGIGDFHAAMVAAFDYVLEEPGPASVPTLTPRLQLLAGVAAFYSGEDAIAAAALDAYLAQEPIEVAAPEAVAARYTLYVGAARQRDANRLLSEARRAQPDVDWDTLLGE